MFKLINSVVQTIAKLIAFAFGLVLTVFIFLLAKLDAFVMVGIAFVVWALYKIALGLNKLTRLILWVPEKLAVQCFLFALDISDEEHREQLEAVEKALAEQLHLKSFAEKAEKRATDDAATFYARNGQTEEEANNDPS